MTRAETKSYIKREMEQYLHGRGLFTEKPFRCLNPAHPDKNPSMRYVEKRMRVHCFACGADYDTVDLIGIEYGISESREIFQKAHEVFGFQVGAHRRSRQPLPKPEQERHVYL